MSQFEAHNPQQDELQYGFWQREITFPIIYFHSVLFPCLFICAREIFHSSANQGNFPAHKEEKRKKKKKSGTKEAQSW